MSQPVTHFAGPPEPLSRLLWSTNLILLHKLKDPATRLWYARKTLENIWSRAVLTVPHCNTLPCRSVYEA